MGELKNLEQFSYHNNSIREVPPWYGKLPNIDPLKMHSLIEMVMNAGSSEAEKRAWEEVKQSFIEGDVSTVFNLMRRTTLNNRGIELFEDLLLSPKSQFRKNLNQQMLLKDTDNDSFGAISELIKRNSKKIYPFLLTTLSELIVIAKKEELFRITKYLFFLKATDIEEILSKLNHEQIEELMRAFIVDHSNVTNDVYHITKFKRKPFKYLYFLIEKLQDEKYQNKIIIDMFLDYEYSYFLGLIKEDQE